MLIIKAFVNEREIDAIYVQNVEHIFGDDYRYAVRRPDTGIIIDHCREDGWKALAIKVLEALDD